MSDHYGQFIEEAFIEPIRSVLIVDDDYPTTEEVLDTRIKQVDGEETDNKKKWYSHPQSVKTVLDEFRNGERSYLLDIHDAQQLTPSGELVGAEHLHQTDLLILDYQLDRSKKKDGTLAVKIARQLLKNNHFNLIVVNTNEFIDEIFPDFLLGLLRPSLEKLTNEENNQLETAYSSFDPDDDTIPGQGFNNSLKNALQFEQYISYLKRKSLRGLTNGDAVFARATKVFEDYKVSKKFWGLFGKNALIQYETEQSAKLMCDEDLGIIDFSNDKVKWIRSNKAFIAFAHKPDGDQLIQSLSKALLNWKPEPSRLFLAKLSAEMDEHGFENQEQALADNDSSALWYQRLLEAKGGELEFRIFETVQRHSEEMVRCISPGIREFAHDLALKERKETKCENIQVVQQHYSVDLSDEIQQKKAHINHNFLVSNIEPSDWHLQTGHVFKVQNDYWICASPACDTVPDQITKSQRKDQGDRLRFIAVRLHKITKYPEDIQSNRYVFLKIDDEICTFGFSENAVAMPHWTTMFAEDRGFIRDGQVLSLTRVEQDKTTKKLVTKSYTAKIVGQLRYEYALNFIQRLSNSLSRIGLDYAGD